MLRNQKGQFLIESVLLMVLSIGLLTVGLRSVRNGNYIKKIVAEPWIKVAAMIENGVWSNTPQKARADHPNTGRRGRTLDPIR